MIRGMCCAGAVAALSVWVAPWVPWWTTAGCIALAGVLAWAVVVCASGAKTQRSWSTDDIEAHLTRVAAIERATAAAQLPPQVSAGEGAAVEPHLRSA